MTSDPDDSELIARSLNGDEDAFVEVVRRHEAAVGAYLARRAGRDRAEDLLGEVWTAAFTSRAAYDRSFPDAGPWLFGVAHNTLRRYWRSRPAEDLMADVTGLASGWDPWTAVDRRVDAESVLRHALAQLPTQFREVIVLREINQLNYRDIAEIINVPIGTVMSRLARARAHVKAILEGERPPLRQVK